MLQGDDEFANVRSGPAADAPIVARINAGEPFNTYPQDGIWWRVQHRRRPIGYIERAHIRLREPIGVPSLEPAPGNQAAPAPGNQVRRPRRPAADAPAAEPAAADTAAAASAGRVRRTGRRAPTRGSTRRMRA